MSHPIPSFEKSDRLSVRMLKFLTAEYAIRRISPICLRLSFLSTHHEKLPNWPPNHAICF